MKTVGTRWAAVVLCGLLSTLALSRSGNARGPEPSPGGVDRVGVVTIVAGSVVVDRPALPQTTARAGDAVFLRDTITTGDGARIEMVLAEKVDIAIHQRSKVTVTEVPGRGVLVLHAGLLAMRIAENRMRPEEEIRVGTPNAIAVVRGDVRMTVETAPSGAPGSAVVTYVDVLAGTIDLIRYTVTPDATPVARPAIRLGAHEGVTITGGTAGPIRPLRMVNPALR